MPIRQTLQQARVPVHIYTDEIEAQALQPLLNFANLSIVRPYVAAMPDVHAGIGAKVGSVIPTRNAIIPAAVGVDIGCGMNVVRTTLKASDLPKNLLRIRSAIEASVPTMIPRKPGRSGHCIGVRVRYRIAFGPRPGQKVLTLQGALPREISGQQKLCANLQGFSLHAGVRDRAVNYGLGRERP
jgi:hypothetical protein